VSGYDDRVRWLLPLIGALGFVGACAGLLGIESPSDPVGSEAAPRDAGDAGDVGEDAPGDGSLAGDVGAAFDGADDGSAPDSAASVIGVPCGSVTCTVPAACCYGKAPVVPLGCMTSDDCGVLGDNIEECDGPEDCLPGNLCCVEVAASGGGFSLRCAPPDKCGAPTACHPATATCKCELSRDGCLPATIRTCDGRCN
jgi:hypothetical protein